MTFFEENPEEQVAHPPNLGTMELPELIDGCFRPQTFKLKEEKEESEI